MLAEGTKLGHLTSLDLAYMEEITREYRTYQFTDSSRNLSTLVTYPDINKGFSQSETKYSKILYLPEETRYFNLQGNLAHTVTERNESNYSSPFHERDFEGVTPLENTASKYHFAIPGFELVIDLVDLTIFRTIETEEFGLTEIFEQYIMDVDSNFHLTHRISSSPLVSPTGACVYNVVEENIQKVQNGQSLLIDDAHVSASISKSEEIVIFPNPATDHVNIKIKDFQGIKEDFIKVSVSALSGKLVSSETFILGSNITLNTTAVPNGIYIIRVSHGDYLQTEKLIIQK